MRGLILLSCLLALSGAAAAEPSDCPGNPDALGTSRTLVAGPDEPLIGTMQYRYTLPLNDHEVVLTFDDGPLPPFSTSVLQTLAKECVKATYFMVGQQAAAFPDMVREVYNAGHTIGTHSQHHPLTFNRMRLEKAEQEIDEGFASVRAALDDPKAVAPYFRIPGLLRVKSVENYLASQSIVTWSADLTGDDWHRRITAKQILRLTLSRLEQKGKGVVLLHDIQPATALMLPDLLRELKKRGFKIVHVVPPDAEPLHTLPLISKTPPKQGWPRITTAGDELPASVIAKMEEMSNSSLRHMAHPGANRAERHAAKGADRSEKKKRVARNGKAKGKKLADRTIEKVKQASLRKYHKRADGDSRRYR